MSEYYININKRQINSIEVPKNAVVEVGEDLVLKLNNHGSPLHITISAVNARRFTHFLHENLYLQENLEFKIPIFSTAPTGSFQIEVITGYGIVKESFKVSVCDKELEIPEILDDIPSIEPEKNRYVYPALLITLVVLGWAAYIAGYLYYGNVPGFASVIILTLAVLVAWRCRP
ncbi:hypothetical protein L1994_11130 [Methanomicrobium antiquum]|uniref:Uncharacterized protein n=1 Tax=Methanomicrobium antiquum TaxID=487686 RepID=A0AAF0FLF4_9EURY|nr:hypothetical protein [Methanomicrobium antiquum]MDD3977969.1 hypothetical protein [Methanomicrobium sp.]WFN36678.1 hypothetical protein L1994_11130 [Methanomicrobium antiquum]